MTAYTVVRAVTVALAVLTAVLFIYMDRQAWSLYRRGLLSGGEFLGKVARVLYMFATANSSWAAVQSHKPAGQFVIFIFLGGLLLAVAAVWQTHDSWHNSKRRKARP